MLGSLPVRRKDVENTFLIKRCRQFRVLTGVFRDVKRPILRRLGIAVCVFFHTNAALLLMAMIVGTSSLTDFFSRIGNIASFITVMTITFFYTRREERITLVCHEMAEQWLKYKKKVRYPSGIKTIKMCERMMKFMFWVLVIGSFSVFNFYTTYPIIVYYFFPLKSQKYIAFPLRIYFPFESAPYLRAYVYFIMCACIGYYCILLAIISSMYLCLFCKLEASFILNGAFYERFRAQELNPRPGGNVVRKDEIIRKWNVARIVLSISEHQSLYRMAEDLKEFIRESILVMYIGAMIAVTFTSYIFINDPERYAYGVTLMIIPVVHIFAFFFMASRVTVACEETANILYQEHLDLLKEGSEIRFNVLLFLLMRSQKPVVFEAGRLRELTLFNFVSFMQNLYSFVMLMHSLKEATL
ncbi:unnamed protein product [Bemisia tabaci]|uniref:Odorant receptor n=1 Tax=Bemisia tabaci TaxID=7038 RepID=A0A9P0A1P6_BEMTA|nr:unnamed protein product [Bemisia tabaci]